MRGIRRSRQTLAASVAALLPFIAAPLAAQTIAITGGKVYPVSGAPIENGTVLIRDGRIVEVGANVRVPDGAQRVDATGKWVTPGFINSTTQLGLGEIGFGGPPTDQSARGRDRIAASFAVWEGLNPTSVYIAPARQAGITSVVLTPTGGLIAGQQAIIDLVDGSVSDMLVRAPVAMAGEIGSSQRAGVTAKGEILGKLRELLDDTRAYARRRSEYERAQTRPFAASRLDLEALIPVVEGRLPLVLSVDKASDIEEALRLAKEFNLKVVIQGGAEAWMVADKLAAAKIPVLAGAMSNIPTSFDALGSRQENPALLRRAGVSVAIIGNGGGDEETFNVRNVKYEAGNAVAYGMRWDDALRAVTLTPAELFGVADRIGSLQPGRVANVVVWSGDPFEFSTRAEHVFVHGRDMAGANSRQDELMRRYKTLPPNYQSPLP